MRRRAGFRLQAWEQLQSFSHGVLLCQAATVRILFVTKWGVGRKRHGGVAVGRLQSLLVSISLCRSLLLGRTLFAHAVSCRGRPVSHVQPVLGPLSLVTPSCFCGVSVPCWECFVCRGFWFWTVCLPASALTPVGLMGMCAPATQKCHVVGRVLRCMLGVQLAGEGQAVFV